ncbi:hypothetical protein H4582DRAFT_2142025 [Lactarius indigo]|nr:hypothetical protein H4582DRAFT_2142025 [Lactarius indigo]
MDDQDRYIYLKDIYVNFIKRRPTSDLELIFKDDAGVKHKSAKFKKGDLVHWNLDIYAKTKTSATLSIQRARFKISVANISIEFKPNQFGDDRAVGLEDNNHRVTVNFLCGRSRTLTDVARVLGSQAHTVLALRVNMLGGFEKYHHIPETPPIGNQSGSLTVHLASPPPPLSPEQEYDVLYAAIDRLNDDILLGIFDFYRLHDQYSWNVQLGWCKLSHVCQKWRHLIFESAFYLSMHILCTNGAPMVDTLDHLPPLPLFVNYRYTNLRQDELGISHALRLRNRVRRIDLHLSPSILHKFLMLMDEPFPILEHLSLESLSFTIDKTTLTLPKTFQAPNLRHLTLLGTGLPKRLRFLSSAVSLVTLVITNIQASGYFLPRLLAARLQSLPQLEELSIGFSVPIPRPSAERELLSKQGTPVALPNLKRFTFRGVNAYLECLVAQIRAPLLERPEITLFNQIVFTLPRLSHFINTAERIKPDTADVIFGPYSVSIIMGYSTRPYDEYFVFCVTCKQMDWQIGCAAQICDALMPTLSGVEKLTLILYEPTIPTQWRNSEIDGITWLELLRSFIGAKELRICQLLSEELSRALQMDNAGSDPELLPGLQELVSDFEGKPEHADSLFNSFVHARQVAGRPVRSSFPLLPPLHPSPDLPTPRQLAPLSMSMSWRQLPP